MMRSSSYLIAFSVAACVLGQAAFAAPATPAASPTLPPIVKPKAPVANPVVASLDIASAQLHAGQWFQAAETYAKLVNVDDATRRIQARYGLALALSQLGEDDKAYTALEGSLRDETPYGKAVGLLRARLALQLADKALVEHGPDAAEPYLSAYEHSIDQPDHARYERIRAAGFVPAAASPTVLRVGVLLPQTGELKPVGQGVIQGLQLGLKDFDGRAGTRLELHVEAVSDTATATVAAKALLEKGVDVVVGPLLAPTVAPVRDVLKAAGVPILTLSSDRSAVGDGVHALNYLPAEQARAVAQAAVSMGKTKFAALAPQTPYGYEAFQAFQDEVQRLGATVQKQAFYNPKEVDIGASIRSLMTGVKKGDAPGFDALFVPAPALNIPLVVSQLSYYDVDKAKPDGQKVQLLGTALWQSPKLLVPSAAAVQGGVFAAPPQIPAFDTRFEATFHTKPPALAILGYDVARILADVAAEKQRTGQDVGALLLRPEGFYGTGGYVVFNPNGTTRRGLAMVKVGSQFEVTRNALVMAPLVRE